tara:strand:- start:186 stop:470 length:285 start_codon:yes stop_codon:yes gene_type:complete
MAKMARMSFTVPPSLRDDLDYVAMRLGVSKSSVLTSMLTSALSDVTRILHEVPLKPTDRDSLRFRDSSVRLIHDRMRELDEILKDAEVGDAGIR